MEGMDQKKQTCLFLDVRQKITPLHQRLVEVKVHGKRNCAFLVDSTVSGGSNLITVILRQVLLDLDSRNELPSENPKLYLQVDNCGHGENKNKIMFAFLVDRYLIQ